MEREVRVVSVDAHRTASGDTRFVLHTDDGDEYLTFEEDIVRRAVDAEARRIRIEYHEQQRRGSKDVYLDGVEPLEQAADEAGENEVDWLVAVEAMPWLRRDGEE